MTVYLEADWCVNAFLDWVKLIRLSSEEKKNKDGVQVNISYRKKMGIFVYRTIQTVVSKI